MSSFKSNMSLDECQIHRAIRSFGVFADNGQFELLASYFTDVVSVDYTSAYGGEKTTPSKSKLMSDWQSVLPGFDAICHRIFDIEIISIAEGDALARAKVNASHVIDHENFEIGGSYIFELQRIDNDWKICSLTFLKEKDNGKAHLLEAASKRVNLA